jgi:outer membrane protein, heavy metal efflux system
LQTARSASARNLGALAQALSLPLPLVRTLRLDYADLLQTASTTQQAETRRAALLNRLDIRGKLVEYAAAEADVRLEVARQYPTLAITPGFLWDQGDNIWSLAATIVPAVLGNRPAIAAAEARREVEASQFRALQDRVIGEAQGAEAAYASLALALTRAEQANVLYTRRAQQTERQFEAGYTDRVELTAAHLETIEAQRGALALRIEALRAQGILEDALQMPLTGGPLPQLADTPPASITGLARQ